VYTEHEPVHCTHTTKKVVALPTALKKPVMLKSKMLSN
jgi:hypothetical protein